MAQTIHLIDGRFGLKQQEDQLNFIETAAFCEVLTYAKHGTGPGTVNRAVFDDVPFDKPHTDLELVEIAAAANVGSIMAEKIAAGKNVVFHATVFVEGRDAVVVAFR